MNRDTDRRMNPYLVAWSRSHGFVDPASNTFRITLIQLILWPGIQLSRAGFRAVSFSFSFKLLQ